MRLSMKQRVLAIEEIKRGQELINSLQSHHLINLPSQASQISKQILHAFTAALSLLNSIDSVDDDDDDDQCKINQKVGSNYKKRRFVAAASQEHRDQRMKLKRKKQVESWTTITPAPHADGHQWRKYGQKNIHNFIHPRSYYRCTHKDDQGCLAIKLVQQEECTAESTIFRVIYKNKHTCTSTIEPQIIFSSPPIQSNFFILETKNSNHGVIKKASNREKALPLSPNKMIDPQYNRDSCCSSLMNSTLSDLTDVKNMEDDAISSTMDLLFSDFCGFEFEDVESLLDTITEN